MSNRFCADGFSSRYEEAPYRERDLNEHHTPRRRTLNAAGTVKTRTEQALAILRKSEAL
jgi:hypothetical protein